MPTAIAECPACRIPLEQGFVLQESQHGSKLLSWIEGQPEPSFWTGLKTRGRRKHDLGAWRCPRCGWVIWFAPAQSDEQR